MCLVDYRPGKLVIPQFTAGIPLGKDPFPLRKRIDETELKADATDIFVGFPNHITVFRLGQLAKQPLSMTQRESDMIKHSALVP